MVVLYVPSLTCLHRCYSSCLIYFVVQATVLIETLPAAFEMDEILFELREHSAGLNCGRWDYIFSFIKTLREDPKSVMPDRCERFRTSYLKQSSLLCSCSSAACWLLVVYNCGEYARLHAKPSKGQQHSSSSSTL